MERLDGRHWSASGASSNSPFRYRPFGYLRFLLALMVLVQHYSSDVAPNAVRQALLPWGSGNVAVLGFFILSGFIICEAYHANYWNRPLAFIENRFLRILPGYWAALTLSIGVHWAILHYSHHLVSLDRHVIAQPHFGLHNLWKNYLFVILPISVNVTATEYAFVPYAWALQTEMMFYLAVFATGLVYRRLVFLRQFPQGVWLALAGVAGIAAASLFKMHLAPRQLEFGSYFVLGGAFYFLQAGYRKALLLLVPAGFQILWQFRDYGSGTFTAVAANRPGQMLLLAMLLAAIATLSALKVKPLKTDKWLGHLSYPLYLNHYAIGVIMLNLAPGFSVSLLVIGTAASVLLSPMMFLLVEAPLTRLRSSIRARSRMRDMG